MSKINYPLPSKDVLRPGDIYKSGNRKPFKIIEVRETDFSYRIIYFGKRAPQILPINYDMASEIDGIFLRETEGKLEVVALSAKTKKDWPQ